MRCAPLPFLTLAMLVFFTRPANAQDQFRHLRVAENRVQVGFQSISPGASADGFKTGLWAPILVTFVDDPLGNIRLPVAVDGSVRGELLVETADNDSTSTVYAQGFNFSAKDPLQVLSYVKVASASPEIRLTVKAGDKSYSTSAMYFRAIDVGQHLYLVLGDKISDLHESLVRMLGNQPNQENLPDSGPRFAAYANNACCLPDLWFGYNAVDLAILVSSNGKFVDSLVGDRQSTPQLQALAEWVRRGGRLVVSVAPTNRDKVQRLLSSPAWQPPLPALLAADSKTIPLESLADLRNWSNTGRALLPEAFQPSINNSGQAQARNGVRLEKNPAVAVLCAEPPDSKDSSPLIVRFPHGTGSITLVAFDLNDPFLHEWPGRFDFWQSVVKKLAAGRNPGAAKNPDFARGGWVRGTDVASGLYDELEKFDSPRIAFGWVVLFTFIYIVIVGPVDYLVLKLVFKRLELTWITFPAVVITVSLLAYFTAYAIKGQDLKVNKVDLVDIDMRSFLGEDFQPAGATAYGTTWFAILSPRIQNYTIGIEPVLHNWRPSLAAPAQPVQPTMSWFGRPELWGMGSTGRGRSPSLFSRSYSYQPEAAGLVGVPIPVWMIRSFTATWQAPFDKANLPFESRLTYEVGKSQSLAGTLKNNLAVDLHEAGLIHRGKFYPLADIPKGATVTLKLDPLGEQALHTWVNSQRSGLNQPPVGKQNQSLQRSDGYFNPGSLLRDLMFHEKVDTNTQYLNHAHRSLDWSWRLDQEGNDAGVQEIILVARVRRVSGALEQLQADHDGALPTHLWLGEPPGTPLSGQTANTTPPSGKALDAPVFLPRPALQGSLVQDTFIRVILPVAPLRTP